MRQLFIVILWLVVVILTSCAYPRVSSAELDRRMEQVDKLVKFCQTKAEVGHPTLSVENERFTICVKENN